MEHLLIYLIHFILWLDRQWHKPLKKVVPDLEELLGQPQLTLARQEIVIGPMRRWASSITLGLVLTGILGCIWYVGLLLIIGKRWGANLTPSETAAFWAGILAIGFFMILLMFRFLGGGEVTLKSDGVEFRYGQSKAFCPWALFNATGNPFQPSDDRLMLPIDSSAIPFVLAYQEDMLVGQGVKIRTKMIGFKSRNLALLKALYEVKIDELGKLFLRIGRELAPERNEEIVLRPDPEDETLDDRPIIERQADDWLIVTLTHLNFPPYCCECGAKTKDTEDFPAQSFIGEPAQITIPYCEECQARATRQQRRAVGRGVVLGAGVGLVMSMILVIFLDMLIPFIFALSIPFMMMGFIMGAVWGQQRGKRQTSPVELKDYSPSEGIVTMRFRNRTYNEALIESMMLHRGANV